MLRDVRTIGVVVAGLGGVGQCFARELMARFDQANARQSSSSIDVRLLALGDSKSYVCHRTGFSPEQVENVLSHTARALLDLKSWSPSETEHFESLDALIAHLENGCSASIDSFSWTARRPIRSGQGKARWLWCRVSQQNPVVARHEHVSAPRV